ncbi:hypothetical protein CBS101457_006156 [Exobasidium rhododendri]|nr:hypothetical protein CBS101457_006156 [Exobasidium rhododendri]
MPSYADEYAARHPDLRGKNSGPVRLTISRGEYVRDTNGKYSYVERWDQEDIMDMEVPGSDDTEAVSSQSPSQGPEKKLVDTIKERFLGHHTGSRAQRYSLLVLDTPLSLIIPHTVLSELDNLKSSTKGNVGPAARAANNWILTALQTQKKQMYDIMEMGTRRRQNIPERSWVVHVENTAHSSALEHLNGPSGSLGVGQRCKGERGKQGRVGPACYRPYRTVAKSNPRNYPSTRLLRYRRPNGGG